MTSENILPNYYKDIKDAIKIAGQIRRSSLLVHDEESNWRVLIINERTKIYEDLKELNLPEADGYIYINDNYGTISRNKTQLNIENIMFFSRAISDYNAHDNPFTQRFNDIPQKLKALITTVQTNELEKPKVETRAGLYNLRNREFSVYYKKFYSDSVKLEQIVSETEYEDITLYISINNKDALGVIEPVLRKHQVEIESLYNHVLQNKAIEITLKPKEKIFQRLKDIMFQIKNPEDLFEIKSPIGKYVLTDLTNYNLTELKLL